MGVDHSKLLGVSVLFMLGLIFHPVPPVRALPQGEQVAGGSVSFQRGNSELDINQASGKAIVNWGSFDIGEGEVVRINQPGAGASILNRIGGGSTTIAGSLQANGNVFLINRSGILFAPSAQVNVHGLVASAFDMSDADFMSGILRFSGPGGSVVNQGSINAAFAYLIGGTVRNDGSIAAGDVILAAGQREVQIDNVGGGQVRLIIDGEEIGPDGRPLAGDDLESDRSDESDGSDLADLSDPGATEPALPEITAAELATATEGLLPGDVVNTGVVDVRDEAGGTIRIAGEAVAQYGQLIADATESGGGRIDIRSKEVIVIGDRSTTSADGGVRGSGGIINIFSEGRTGVGPAATLSARGGADAGDGGFVEASGRQYIELNTLVDVSAPAGRPGTLLIDPDRDILIETDNDNDPPSSGGSFQDLPPNTWIPTQDTSVIRGPLLNSQLQLGDVVVFAESEFGTRGNIFVLDSSGPNFNEPLELGGGNTLFLESDNETRIQVPVIPNPFGAVQSFNLDVDAGTFNLDSSGSITTGGGFVNVLSNDEIGLQPGTLIDTSASAGVGGSISLTGDVLDANGGIDTTIADLSSGGGAITVLGSTVFVRDGAQVRSDGGAISITGRETITFDNAIIDETGTTGAGGGIVIASPATIEFGDGSAWTGSVLADGTDPITFNVPATIQFNFGSTGTLQTEDADFTINGFLAASGSPGLRLIAANGNLVINGPGIGAMRIADAQFTAGGDFRIDNQNSSVEFRPATFNVGGLIDIKGGAFTTGAFGPIDTGGASVQVDVPGTIRIHDGVSTGGGFFQATTAENIFMNSFFTTVTPFIDTGNGGGVGGDILLAAGTDAGDFLELGGELRSHGGAIDLSGNLVVGDPDRHPLSILSDNGPITIRAINSNVDLESGLISSEGTVGAGGTITIDAPAGNVFIKNTLRTDTGNIVINSAAQEFTTGTTTFLQSDSGSLIANGNRINIEGSYDFGGDVELTSIQDVSLRGSDWTVGGNLNLQPGTSTLIQSDNLVSLQGGQVHSQNSMFSNTGASLQIDGGDFLHDQGIFALATDTRLTTQGGEIRIEPVGLESIGFGENALLDSGGGDINLLGGHVNALEGSGTGVQILSQGGSVTISSGATIQSTNLNKVHIRSDGGPIIIESQDSNLVLGDVVIDETGTSGAGGGIRLSAGANFQFQNFPVNPFTGQIIADGIDPISISAAGLGDISFRAGSTGQVQSEQGDISLTAAAGGVGSRTGGVGGVTLQSQDGNILLAGDRGATIHTGTFIAGGDLVVQAPNGDAHLDQGTFNVGGKIDVSGDRFIAGEFGPFNSGGADVEAVLTDAFLPGQLDTDGGNLSVQASTMNFDTFPTVLIDTVNGVLPGGNINLIASGTLSLDGAVASHGGSITFQAQNINSNAGTDWSVRSDGGPITFTQAGGGGNRFNLGNNGVVSSAGSSGPGGPITFAAESSIALNDVDVITDGSDAIVLNATESIGLQQDSLMQTDAGNIDIDGNFFGMASGAAIQSTAGSLDVTVNDNFRIEFEGDINVGGNVSMNTPNDYFLDGDLVAGGNIDLTGRLITIGRFNPASITLSGGQFTAQGSSVQFRNASTLDTGGGDFLHETGALEFQQGSQLMTRGGNLTVAASANSFQLRNNSAIDSGVGDISLLTPNTRFFDSDAAVKSVGGDILFSGNNLQLTGTIDARGSGGDIVLRSENAVTLDGVVDIVTGDSGTIVIAADLPSVTPTPTLIIAPGTTGSIRNESGDIFLSGNSVLIQAPVDIASTAGSLSIVSRTGPVINEGNLVAGQDILINAANDAVLDGSLSAGGIVGVDSGNDITSSGPTSIQGDEVGLRAANSFGPDIVISPASRFAVEEGGAINPDPSPVTNAGAGTQSNNDIVATDRSANLPADAADAPVAQFAIFPGGGPVDPPPVDPPPTDPPPTEPPPENEPPEVVSDPPETEVVVNDNQEVAVVVAPAPVVVAPPAAPPTGAEGQPFFEFLETLTALFGVDGINGLDPLIALNPVVRSTANEAIGDDQEESTNQAFLNETYFLTYLMLLNEFAGELDINFIWYLFNGEALIWNDVDLPAEAKQLIMYGLGVPLQLDAGQVGSGVAP